MPPATSLRTSPVLAASRTYPYAGYFVETSVSNGTAWCLTTTGVCDSSLCRNSTKHSKPNTIAGVCSGSLGGDQHELALQPSISGFCFASHRSFAAGAVGHGHPLRNGL